MLKEIYAVYDVKAGTIASPLMLFPNRGVAVRSFRDALTADSPMRLHPEDYCLFFLGTLDPELGLLTGVEHAFSMSKVVARADDLVAELREQARRSQIQMDIEEVIAHA